MRGPKSFKKNLKNLFSFSFMTSSPLSLPGKNHSLINIVEGERDTVEFLHPVMQASRTRVPVARSLSPSPRLLIFYFPACPFVMDTFAKLLSPLPPPFLSPGGGGAALRFKLGGKQMFHSWTFFFSKVWENRPLSPLAIHQVASKELLQKLCTPTYPRQ